MSGQGAYLFGGRWNSPGRRAVYVSGTLTLAMLEVLVHIDDTEAFLKKSHIYHNVRFNEADVAVLEASSLPQGWNARPETRASQRVGDEFLERAEHPVLALPSMVVPRGLRYDPLYMNYLLNPEHPKVSGLELGAVEGLDWDPRLAI